VAKWRWRGLLLAVLAWFGSGLVLAGDLSPPQQTLAAASARLRATLGAQRPCKSPICVRQVIEQVLMPLVDMSRMPSLILGRHWREASASQKEQFADQFQRLLINTYGGALAKLEDWRIHFKPLPVQVGEMYTLVETQVRTSGKAALAVNYSMHQANGEWRVYDISVGPISLVANYRSRFARLIAQVGLDGLIQQLMAVNQK
jgi:phospholipid transport system substrate-binding protein